MKRYVLEIANDLIRSAREIGKAFPYEGVDKLVQERIEQINKILELREYGYVGDLTAVELLIKSEFEDPA